MRSLDDFVEEHDRASLRHTLVESFRWEGPWVERERRRLLSFPCNDYLNLSHYPALKNAATAEIAHYDVRASASPGEPAALCAALEEPQNANFDLLFE